MKLNRKGYLTIEIILGAVIAFGIAFFLIEITTKLVSVSEDNYKDTIVSTDNALIISGVKAVVENNIDGINNINCSDNSCTITYLDNSTGTLKIEDHTVKYEKRVPDDETTSYDKYEKELDSSLSDIQLTSNIDGEVANESNIYFKISSKNIYSGKDYDIIIPIDNLKQDNVCNIPSVTSNINLATYITNLYDKGEKEIVTNNNIEYNTVSCLGLMNDRLGSSSINIDSGNIRYYGADPNNYIYFNCDDYSNQTKDTCELWRIIGVFENGGNIKTKIVRNKTIGRLTWDVIYAVQDVSYGVNQWGPSSNYDGADLMKLLNPGYESNKDSDYNGNKILINNSLYWNREQGKCYITQDLNYVDDCDFSSTGLKNDITKNMISDSIWYLGNWNAYNIYPDQIYNYERGNIIISRPSDGVKRTTTWTGKIGLLNLSDVGYARDFNKCTTDIRYYYDDTYTPFCVTYIYSIYKNDYGMWLLNASNSQDFHVWYLTSEKTIIINTVNSNDVFPTLYLNQDILVKSGNGSIDDPYQITF